MVEQRYHVIEYRHIYSRLEQKTHQAPGQARKIKDRCARLVLALKGGARACTLGNFGPGKTFAIGCAHHVDHKEKKYGTWPSTGVILAREGQDQNASLGRVALPGKKRKTRARPDIKLRSFVVILCDLSLA